MKKILLVDDDDYKIANIKSFLEEEKEYSIAIENALNPGLRRIREENFDLILLDMSMPTFKITERKNFNSFGGIDFLREMKRKKNCTPVIIVTQYEIFGEGMSRKTAETIDLECKESFDNYKGIVIYSSTKNTWKEKLMQIIGS
jgi:CheY-like chemotaxis protein